MEKKKEIRLVLFTVLTTISATYFNWSEFSKGNPPTIFNLVVSISFILVWVTFSIYWGLKGEKTYLKFIIVYWGINIIYFVVLAFTNGIFVTLAI